VRSLVMTWHQRNDTRPAHAWLRNAISGLFTSAASTFAVDGAEAVPVA
jgi:hypothetical protein